MPSVSLRLNDIIEASERLRRLLADVSLEKFEADWQKQWLVKRGIEIVSETSRHLPADTKARHAALPWRRIAGIGNVLRHNYEHVSAPIMYALVQNKLPALEQICREELAADPDG
jgi:uncharacterized protein with HEPN domain